MKIEASVIISFYNKVDALKLVLSGFERQTQKNFEIIIADDGSNYLVVNELKQIIAGSEMIIKHVWHPDKGWQKNIILNKAIIETQAEYIIFTDGDCIPHRHFIKEHVLEKQKKQVHTGRRVMLSKRVTESLTAKMVRKGYLENALVPWMIIERVFGHGQFIENAFYFKFDWIRKRINKKNKGLLGSNFSLHKEDLLAINGFDERYLLPYVGEDTDLEYRLRLYGCKFKHLKHLAIQYHLYHIRQSYDKTNLEIFNDNKNRATAYTPFGIVQSQQI
jgi:glycosyltransferase involved in cell wall biosynthesis